VCFSALAGFLAGRAPDDSEIKLLLELVGMGRFWLKMTGVEAAAAPATQEMLRRFVDAALATRDDRLVWGSGSPAAATDVAAHIASALEALRQWVPDEPRRSRILQSSAATLYRF